MGPARFDGWRVVAGAFLILFVAYGAQYSFGVFFAALLADFHWSRASLAGAFSLYAFVYCVFGFPAGRLTDRWGPRVVITGGGLLLGTALMGLATVSSLWQIYLLYGGLAGIGMGTAYVPCNSTVVKWFVRRRGLAVGLATSGASAGTFLLPPVAHLLVSRVGWRLAYVAFGAFVLILLGVLARLMRRDPESEGQHPDGDTRPLATAGAPRGWRLLDAARTRAFWLMGAAFTATWLPIFIPLVHLVSFSGDLGFGAGVGASAVSMLGIGAVAGRLIMGVVSDRIGRKAAIAIGMGLQALVFVAFASVASVTGLYVTALSFGFAYGSVSTLFPAMVGDFFGRDQAGGLVGFLFAISGSLAALGPVGAGAIYDATGRYTLAFLLAAAVNSGAVVLLLLTRPPADSDWRGPSAPVKPPQAR